MPPSPPARGPTDESARLQRVTDLLRAAAGADGQLPFDRFVDIALYAPDVGYYMRPGVRVGRAGDFYTAAHTTPVFGRALARRIRGEFDRLGRPGHLRLVEMGPGDGTLAEDVLQAVAADPVVGSATVEYCFVERSPALAEAVTARLGALHLPPSVTIRRWNSLAEGGLFSGVLFANEFLDALPFRRLVYRAGHWHELGVRVDGPQPALVELGVAENLPPPLLPTTPPEGTTVETSPLAEGFVRELADHLVCGAAVFFDYGDEEAELVSRFPHGSVAAVRSHHGVRDPLESPGSADLSAFVNFTRVRASALGAGLQVAQFGPQIEALARWDLPHLAASWQAEATSTEERVRRQLAVKNLTFGFENFRVLELVAH